MFVRPHATRRRMLFLEELEARLVLSPPQAPVITLDPTNDRFGDQILTVQAYGGSERVAFGVFDTGSSAITFSAADQATFIAKGVGIPVKTTGGATVNGVGGSIVGDVSQPDAILADGIHVVQFSFDDQGSMNWATVFDKNTLAVATGIQALIGSDPGSLSLPTITGTPIFGGATGTPGGFAALIDFGGATFDFSPAIPGFQVSMPDLHFVPLGTKLQGTAKTTQPVTVPLSFFGQGNGVNPGDGISEAPNPMQPSVQLAVGDANAGGKKFLFDTGAQMTVISPALAKELSLDLDNPATSVGADGVSGTASLPGFTLDELIMPSDLGPLTFENVPIFVSELAEGLDGILGMNLFSTAVQMLYNPSTPSVSFTFNPIPEGTEFEHVTWATQLEQLGVPFAGALQNASLPAFSIASGRASGVVYADYNLNHIQDHAEPGLANVAVYVDRNDDGNRDANDPTVTTDWEGKYQFSGLAPGVYALRLVVPPGFVPLSDREIARVLNGTRTGELNFKLVRMSPDPTTAYVEGLYGSILDRVPDPAGQTYWLKQLTQGESAENIASGIWQSPEHRGQQVDRYYSRYLGREPDQGGRAYWVSTYLSGASDLEVQRGFLTSLEYASKHQDDSSFISGLYIDILGRSPDAEGLAYWQAAMLSTLTRAKVVEQFLSSAEAIHKNLDRLYTTYLDRSVDGAGQNYWRFQLQTGQMTWDEIASGILTSQEYLDKQRKRVVEFADA